MLERNGLRKVLRKAVVEKAPLERRPLPSLPWETHITTSSSNRAEAVAWAGKPVVHRGLSKAEYRTDPQSLFSAPYWGANNKPKFSFLIGFDLLKGQILIATFHNSRDTTNKMQNRKP